MVGNQYVMDTKKNKNLLKNKSEDKNKPNTINNHYRLLNKTIIEFQTLYFNKVGIRLSEEESEEKALELLTFFKVIYKPIKKDDQN